MNRLVILWIGLSTILSLGTVLGCEDVVRTGLVHRHGEMAEFYLTSCDVGLANRDNYNCSVLNSYLGYEFSFYLSVNCGLIQTTPPVNYTYLATLDHDSTLYQVDAYCTTHDCNATLACITAILNRKPPSCTNQQQQTENLTIGLSIFIVVLIVTAILSIIYGQRLLKWLLTTRSCRKCCCCVFTHTPEDELLLIEEID